MSSRVSTPSHRAAACAKGLLRRGLAAVSPRFRRPRAVSAQSASPRCGLCGHHGAALQHRGDLRLVWRCEQCSVLFATDPSGQYHATGPPQDDDFSHVTESGVPYLASGEYFIARYQPLLEQLEAWRPPGRLLDIGCGLGFFLEAARRRGWEPVGLDPSRFAADHAARTFGCNVICATLEEAALPAASFDAVALIHSLEHFSDPVATLTDLGRLLRPGGLVVIETPNASSEGYRLFGQDWVLLNPMEHSFVYTPQALARALEAAGLQVLAISAPLRDPPPHRDLLRGWAQLPRRVPMTRAEVVLRIGRTLRLAAAGTGPYEDMPSGEGEAELHALAEARALPWPGPQWEPHRLATRAEVGAMLAIVLGIAPPMDRPGEGPTPAPPFFADVPGPSDTGPGHPAWRPLHLLRQVRFGGGFERETFRPDEPITEAELETLLRCAVRWRAAHPAPSGAP